LKITLRGPAAGRRFHELFTSSLRMRAEPNAVICKEFDEPVAKTFLHREGRKSAFRVGEFVELFFAGQFLRESG
jgi:hypothetical protein